MYTAANLPERKCSNACDTSVTLTTRNAASVRRSHSGGLLQSLAQAVSKLCMALRHIGSTTAYIASHIGHRQRPCRSKDVTTDVREDNFLATLI